MLKFNDSSAALMDPYLAQYNNYINLLAILITPGKRIGDLPSMPQDCTPTETPSLICWNSVLEHCFQENQCRFIKEHVWKGEVMDAFADSVTDVISKRVLYYASLPQGGTSPGGKCKLVEGREEAWQKQGHQVMASIRKSNSDRSRKITK